MDWVEFLRQTENKMAHLHKAMDEISLKPEYTETLSAMTEVLRDYQTLLEKAREELNESEIGHRREEQ
ncbi:hypothetical protein [Brevibacillus sp. H7]|uniref:hypothetical protein n=1 Tax=Brevibacillus sp. H7 TaxID=3349138 RepID=UPI0037F93CAF